MKDLIEEEIHLRDYWKILSKRRTLVLIFFFLTVGMVTVFSFSISPTYISTTRLLLEKENPTISFTRSVGYFEVKQADELFQTHKELMETRSFADRVVRKFQLDKHAYVLNKIENNKNSLVVLGKGWLKQTLEGLLPAPVRPVSPSPEIEFLEELDPDLTDMVLEAIEVEHERGSDIFQISYLSDDPNFAVFMANGIARTYIEHNLNIRITPFKNAVEWLSGSIVELREKLEGSERSLQKYKEDKEIVSFESRENVITQKLKELISQIVRAGGKKQEAEARYKQIKSVINKPELLATVPDIMNNPVIQSLRIGELKGKQKISEYSSKYGYKHPTMIKARADLKEIRNSLISEARKMLNAAKTEFQIARSRETSLKRAIEKQKQEVLDLSRKAIEFNVVSGEVQTNKRFYALLLNKLQEASLSSGISVSNVQIVDPAVLPVEPIKPRKVRNILLSVIFGLFGGIGMVFFIEYMDDTIKTQEDVERTLGLPFLGIIPTAKDIKSNLTANSNSGTAEFFRTLHTTIMFSSPDKPCKVILVTSTIPNEGKTTISSNLAISMAKMKKKTLLIDLDFRRPSIHKFFELENEIGASDIIAGNNDVSTALKKMPGNPYLVVLTGGTPAPDASFEHLNSDRLKKMLDEFSKRFDHIILDSPPIMAFSDSLMLANLVDRVLLVVWGGVTAADIIKKGINSLGTFKAKITGVVLNNLSIARGDHYQYYYSYYDEYMGDKAKKKKA